MSHPIVTVLQSAQESFIIAEKYVKAAEVFRKAAQKAIAERKVEVEHERKNMEKAHEAIRGSIEYRQRLTYVVAAFLDVTNMDDEREVGQLLGRQVAAIKEDIETRRRYADCVIERYDAASVDEVVAASIRGHRHLEALDEHVYQR